MVESPTGAFEPFVVHYAETFIVPAAVGPYTVRPSKSSTSRELATLKAFVRPEAWNLIPDAIKAHGRANGMGVPGGCQPQWSTAGDLVRPQQNSRRRPIQHELIGNHICL